MTKTIRREIPNFHSGGGGRLRRSQAIDVGEGASAGAADTRQNLSIGNFPLARETRPSATRSTRPGSRACSDIQFSKLRRVPDDRVLKRCSVLPLPLLREPGYTCLFGLGGKDCRFQKGAGRSRNCERRRRRRQKWLVSEKGMRLPFRRRALTQARLIPPAVSRKLSLVFPRFPFSVYIPAALSSVYKKHGRARASPSRRRRSRTHCCAGDKWRTQRRRRRRRLGLIPSAPRIDPRHFARPFSRASFCDLFSQRTLVRTFEDRARFQGKCANDLPVYARVAGMKSEGGVSSETFTRLAFSSTAAVSASFYFIKGP